MPTIRIEDRLVEEAQQYLEMRGLYRKGMSKRAIIQSCLSYLIHGTPNLKDGREMAGLLIEEELSPKLKGRVSRWIGTKEKSQEYEVKLSAKIRQAQRDLTSEVEISEDIERKEEDRIERIVSNTPPWEGLKTIPFKEIISRNPKHPAVQWAGKDRLRQKALSIAWAAVPLSMQKTPKVAELALSLYREFRRWEDD